MAMPLSMENYLAPCAEILNLRFGKRLQRMGYLILCIRMVQASDVLWCRACWLVVVSLLLSVFAFFMRVM